MQWYVIWKKYLSNMIYLKQINVLKFFQSKLLTKRKLFFFARPLLVDWRHESDIYLKRWSCHRRRAEFELDDKRYFGHLEKDEEGEGSLGQFLTGMSVNAGWIHYRSSHAAWKESEREKRQWDLRVLDRNDIHSSLVLKMHNGYYPGALRVIMCRRYRGAARC